MTELYWYNLLLISFASSSIVFFIVLFFITAPYGRHVRKGWGPRLKNSTGWLLMELPALLVVLILYLLSPRKTELGSIVFLVLWLLHYGYRSLIYPFILRGNKRMPISIILMGATFNIVNGYLQGRWLFTYAPRDWYSAKWFGDYRFIIGVSIYIIGMVINRHSDYILRNLRKPGETGYKIPRGGLYNYISAPNYFGEIIQWFGWALATWSYAGLAFAVWTLANLAPRAWSNHKWYKSHFNDYPSNRKALIPFLW